MSMWTWIKGNIAAIVVPIVSGGIALVISYGTNIAEETTLQNRVNSNAASITELRAEIGSLESDFDELEDLLRDEIRNTEQLITREGRDLERTMIRIEARLDGILRRMAVLDGIGAPIAPSVVPRPSIEEMTVPEFPVEEME